MKPIGRAKAATPHDGARLGRIGEGLIFETNDGFRNILSLDVVFAPGVFATGVLFGPEKRLGNEVSSGRKVEELVLAHDIVQGFLEGVGVIRLAVSLGVIGRLGDIDDCMACREGDVGLQIEGGPELGWLCRTGCVWVSSQ